MGSDTCPALRSRIVLARRLLVFALAMLVVMSLASALAPPPRTTVPEPEGSPSPSAPEPTGNVEHTIEAGAPAPPTVLVQAGDRLTLTVESDEAGAVQLHDLGTLRAIASGAPVVFDVLTYEPGTHPVVLMAADGERTIATVRVVKQPPAGAEAEYRSRRTTGM